MDVYCISVTRTPVRRYCDRASSLLMHNYQQSVRKLYYLWRNAPLQSLNFECCRCKCRCFLIHLPWRNCLPCRGTTSVCLWPAWNGLPFFEPTVLCHLWWGKNWALRKLQFLRLSTETWACPFFFCRHHGSCVFSLWESAVVTWIEPDT